MILLNKHVVYTPSLISYKGAISTVAMHANISLISSYYSGTSIVTCHIYPLCTSMYPWSVCNKHSPTLYSQITGKYAYVDCKIFPHILHLCSISYSCFNGLTINQHFIKPLQGEKCTSYLSVVDLSIVLPRVFFFAAALCGCTNLRLRSRAHTPT